MAYGELIKCKCAVCETEWEATKSKVRACCSRECSEKLRIEKMKASKSKGTSEKPCVVCGNVFEFNPGTKRGQSKKTCSKSCQSKTPREYAKGESHHMKEPAQREKVRSTTIERHGGIGMAVPELSARTRGTMLEKYGVEHALQHRKFKDAAVGNTDWDMHAEKIVRGVMEKHGETNPMHVAEIAEKARATRWSDPENQIYRDMREPEWWNANYVGKNITLQEISRRYGVGGSFLTMVTSQLGIDVYLKNRSSIESFLAEDIASFVPIVTNTRALISPKEIDIWVPSKNLAVEVNGVYWHTEERLGKKYHAEKMRDVEAIGGRLMQFWDSEVSGKRDIVISMIKNACGLSNVRIGARKCIAVKIDRATANEFVNSNHLQGAGTGDSTFVGLYHETELVSVMTLGRCRFGQGTEIVRFAVRIGYSVPGAFTKLLRASGVSGRVVSYSDNRYSTGGVYRAAGFRLEREGRPTMWGTRDFERLTHRSAYMKIKEWEGADPSKTQTENMALLGISTVYDAGQRTWVLDIN